MPLTSSGARRAAALLALLVAAALLPLTAAGSATAAPGGSPGSLFTALPDFRPTEGRDARVVPRSSSAYRVDVGGLRARLDLAPTEREVRRGAAPMLFSMPGPDGRPATFRIHGSPVMQRGLAARHPEIRTYAGRGVTDPAVSIRLDVTPMGFHASVRGPSGARSWYVDPAVNRPGTTTHLVYRRSAVPAPERPFREPDLHAAADALAPTDAGEAPGAEVQRRTYRLALVTDPSYAAYFGTANVLAEKATLMHRVNQIYNDDLGIRMLLVDGTEELNLDTAARASGPNGPCGANGCYDPADLDPESGGCSGALLDRTEFVLGQIIGAENFDIGHIGLGINGGGIAGLGVVGEQYKADGCTGLPFPEGDFYAIDYVAHEMGHQFAGNHTFNGTQGNCSLTNRAGEASVEPGSGSSVMAYAGICDRDDLQPHTDPYFSQRSIDEITDHVTAEPFTYDEQQVVNLQGFDTDGESFQLTHPGSDPVTITRGAAGNYNSLGIALAVQQLTGHLPEVSGYDGASTPGNAGFTLDFSIEGTGVDVETLGVSGVSAGVTGFVGTIYNGGPGTNQGATDASGNHAPSVTAPADRTIPVRTPFALTATGTDSDGQPLTYLWEQNDQGPLSPTGGTALLSNTKSDGPLFRVFGEAAQVSLEDSLQSPAPGINLADGNPTRVFPDLEQVADGHTNAATGTCPAPPADAAAPVPQATVDCYSEFLPTASYGVTQGGAMHFRVTARDLATTGGGTARDDVTLTVDAGAGPFLVSSRATAGQPVEGGSQETVTWGVAGTDTLASHVRITLSTDGGKTFPRVLAASTPNDGSETVALPMVSTSKARIRVEAVDNYFFDLNDADFTIAAPLTLSEVAPQTVQYSDDFEDPVQVTATSTEVDGDQLTAEIAGIDGLSVTRGSTSADGVRPGTAVFTIAGPVTEHPGDQEALLTVEHASGPEAIAESVLAVVVEPEDATVDYTGPTSVATGGGSASVPLETTVSDAADGSAGDIGRASVTFVDRDTGDVLCAAEVVGGPQTGTAGCRAQLTREGDRTTYTIGTVVGGAYDRDRAADDVQVTVAGGGEPPTTEITRGPAAGSFVLARKVRFRFTASPDASSYRCTLDGARVTCSDGEVTLRRLSTGPHVFRVAARDEAGNLDPSPATRRFVSPYDERELTRKGSWEERRARSAYRSTWLRSTDAGASLSRRLDDVTRIALVVGRAPGYGSVGVWFRGERIDTVRLDADRTRGKVLVTVARFDRARSGLLRIETLSGRVVRIEGLGAR